MARSHLQKAHLTAAEVDDIANDVHARYANDEIPPEEDDIAATILLELAEMARERVELDKRFMGALRPKIRFASDGGMVFTWIPRGGCQNCGHRR